MGVAICVAARVLSCRGSASRDRCPAGSPPVKRTEATLHELTRSRSHFTFGLVFNVKY